MKKKIISYNDYLDKVYGCFLGKTICGTIGAPYEGVKMPMEIPFRQEMINTMLPNDDLDLQVLWLDVAEQKGTAFTSCDLLDRFVNFCDYSPGEYAVMRKNYNKGIYPPLSGKFSNDFYIEGMGCPIRSEIWACLAPGDAAAAAEFASRDGCLDHYGESINAERFMAALEADAFFENDMKKLINGALDVVPTESRFRTLVTDIIGWCAEYGNIKKVLNKILFKYGHPDCTNMYQNMGIIISSLLLGGSEMTDTCMMAMNCGFDTDCTCASVGSVIGIIQGSSSLIEKYKLTDIKYVLSVRSFRRSDSVYDLAEDIARLGVVFAKERNITEISNAPDVSYDFDNIIPPVSLDVTYEDDDPSICIGGKRTVYLNFKNNTDKSVAIDYNISAPVNFIVNYTKPLDISAGQNMSVAAEINLAPNAEAIYEKNIFTVEYKTENYDGKTVFGLSGSTPWKVIGPFWRTDPVTNTELLLSVPNYWHLLKNSETEGSDVDRVRHFHLNFAADTVTEYLSPDECFSADINAGYEKAEVSIFNMCKDSFELKEITGFDGPCVMYMCRRLISPENMSVCIQIGHTSPYSLFINGALVSSRKNCDTWTSENVHLKDISLKKGKNDIVLRITKVNADCKYNMIFSRGETCAEHYVCFGSENPALF